MARNIIGFSTINRPYMNYRVYDNNAIKIDLLNEINTIKGDRIMLPEYGSIIWNLLFEDFNPTVSSKIQQDLYNICSKHLVNVNNITVIENIEKQSIESEIDLTYRTDYSRDTLYVSFLRNGVV